jgi:hypothetical protein
VFRRRHSRGRAREVGSRLTETLRGGDASDREHHKRRELFR